MERIMTPRSYIRHPSDVPVEIEPEQAPARKRETLTNVGYGGVSFSRRAPLAPGTVVHVRIATVRPPFEANARVAWCQRTDDLYLIGLAFVTREALYAARMVEQLCHIEHYKQEVLRTEGRTLSGQEAALEWIGKYAGEFPRIDGES